MIPDLELAEEMGELLAESLLVLIKYTKDIYYNIINKCKKTEK